MPATVNRAALAAARQRLAEVPRDMLCAVAADGVPLDAAMAAPDPGGSATVERLQAEIRAAPDGAKVGFRNLAPYAGYVEFGTSKMAPRAFIRGTIARIPAIAAEVASRPVTP